jgi:hypothetical protein
MDEIWQRHKVFILQCVIGGLFFLIALVVMGNAYDGIDILQKSNQSAKAGLEAKLRDGRAPSPASIQAQKKKADEATEQIRATSAEVASLVQNEDYVRENILWILATIGKPAGDAEKYLGIYRQFPLTGLTSVREEARTVLVGRAAQTGRQIDESFGLAGVEPGDEPGALHGLAVACDVIRRCLDREGIQTVSDIRVNPRNSLDRDLPWIAGVEVRLSILGDPDDVAAVLRSFNGLDSAVKRMTVVREVESIVRKNPDEDNVKANVVLLGLQRTGVEGEAQ